MANMKKVNQSIKKAFPNLDIEAVRGDGYVYFNGNDGFDKVPSIMVNPVSVSTDEERKAAESMAQKNGQKFSF